ncbi:MAG TPA: zinc-binding alcohol dehydrogenase family protein [Acetobacteraceae bacterium]|jgi:NADPH:quinone reductase-like Zn-dependent oxidoreductase|nr:zinc-binding alcohol dehydrogenase family protein [Acetobacteraceae bacterium]
MAVRVYSSAHGPDALAEAVRLEPAGRPKPASGQAVIEVRASGVNPSDVKAILGAMPHAVWPRTPGRDYAGVVVDGPVGLIGREVWGSGGELGIRRDGAHAEYLVLDAASVREKPANISLAHAGAIGVPFVTAFEGLREAGSVHHGDVVLVLGANGKVGQAAIQLATAAGAHVFGVERTLVRYRGHATGEVTMLAGDADWPAQLREATDGRGADIVYNTVGSPYFERANRAMAILGRQIFISTIDRAVPFDIFEFYRGRHRFIGLDTLALDSGDGAAILDALRPGFEAGTLKPFPALADYTYPLDRAADAYKMVLGGAPERVVLTPNG